MSYVCEVDHGCFFKLLIFSFVIVHVFGLSQITSGIVSEINILNSLEIVWVFHLNNLVFIDIDFVVLLRQFAKELANSLHHRTLVFPKPYFIEVRVVLRSVSQYSTRVLGHVQVARGKFGWVKLSEDLVSHVESVQTWVLFLNQSQTICFSRGGLLLRYLWLFQECRRRS